jgi:two-component system CheB/CheR fusion protein
MGHLGQLVARRPDGSEFPIEASISRATAGGEILLTVVMRDITERLKISEEAKVARESAETASRAKDQFLALLSHELRNPLTPVLAVVSLLQEDKRFDSATQELFGIVRRNVELEALLIDDLLDVTRITRGKVELSAQVVDLCTVFARAVEVCKGQIEARKLVFAMEKPHMRCLVMADPARLQQVFWNLLQNAVKFTPSGGSLRIRFRTEDESQVVVEVIDSGMGIEAEVLPRIFEAFDQGALGTTRKFGGLGLGLTISRALVQAHGGTLTASSDGQGKGATFTLRMPLAAGYTEASGPQPESTAGGGRPMRILLVEDHSDTCRIISQLLQTHGHQVEPAGDVKTALEIISRPQGLSTR